MRQEKGFTLIEIVIALAIFAIIIFLVSALLNDVFVVSNQRMLALENIDQARLAMITFTNEIRNATTGVDGSYPINQADNNAFIFFSNFKTQGGVVARIRYYLSGNTLYKGTVLPSGSPANYVLSSELIKPVATDINNEELPAFVYYDGSYNGSTENSLSQPINLNQIKFVKINLMVLNQNQKNSSSKFQITGGATIRLLKDNLGN